MMLDGNSFARPDRENTTTAFGVGDLDLPGRRKRHTRVVAGRKSK